LIAVLNSAFVHYSEMNLLTAIIFLYSIPTIKGSHGLLFSESDILNVVKTLEDKIESQEKRIELQGKRIRLLEENCNNKEYGVLTKSRDENCPCDEIQTDIRLLMIENNRRQGEIQRHDTRLDIVEKDVAAHTIRLNTVENDLNAAENDVAAHTIRLNTVENDVAAHNIRLNTVENDVAAHDTHLDTIENPVWFDAYRTSRFDASGWKTLTYTNARKASSYPNAMDIDTGVFTAPETGTYQFIIQVVKDFYVDGYVKIVHEGTSISWIYDNDNSNTATITGTAIIPMEVGQRVWVETYNDLRSIPDVMIHFTGVLLTPK